MSGKHGRGTVLLAWELGEGFGHAHRLMEVARVLEEQGWEPVIASRIIRTMSEQYRDAGYPMLQAPNHTGLNLSSEPFSANTYADIMAICGFADREALYPPVAAWDHLLRMVAPKFIIADYSPLLSLAAFGRIPVIGFGDGFVTPPDHHGGFPPTGSQRDPVVTREHLMNEIRQVQDWRGAPHPASLAEFVCGEGQLVCAFPELDVYRSHRKVPATGPLAATARPLPPATEPRVFVYLSAGFRKTRVMLQAVVNSGLPAEGYIRDLDKDPKLSEALDKTGFVRHDRPPPLPEMMKTCSVIVHHGGAGTLETAALLGRTQLLVPRHLEQSMNAALANSLGSSLRMGGNFEVQHAQNALQAATGEERFHQAAERLAQRLAAFPCETREKLLSLGNRFAQ